MEKDIKHFLDFKKIDSLLEGFNKTTGFVTAILDLDGQVLSKSGWRSICTDFHRVNEQTAQKCTISDTVLANKMVEGETYHFYKCLNGLVDVAVPVIVNGEHIANLFSGQFFFEEPNRDLFIKQAQKYGLNNEKYLKALADVPVFSEERVKTAMNFLLQMTEIIAEMTMQRMESKLFEEAIIRSEEQFRGIFNNLQDAFFQADLMGRFTVVSPSALRMYGFDSADELIGQAAEMLYTARQEREKLITELQAKEHIEDFVVTARKKDGSTFWASMNVRFIRNNNNEITGTEGVVRDISERKQAEEKIKEQSSLIRIAAEKAKLGGWSVDLKENRSYWSDEVAAIHEMPCGYSPLVEDGINFYAPEWRERIIKVFTDCAQNGIPYDEEMEIITSTGKRVWVRTIGEAVRDENGNIFRVQGAFQDITERKQAEKKIKRKRNPLQKNIRRRRNRNGISRY